MSILEKALKIKIIDMKLKQEYKTQINKVKIDNTIKYKIKG